MKKNEDLNCFCRSGKIKKWLLRFLEMTTGIRFKVEGKQIVVSKI